MFPWLCQDCFSRSRLNSSIRVQFWSISCSSILMSCSITSQLWFSQDYLRSLQNHQSFIWCFNWSSKTPCSFFSQTETFWLAALHNSSWNTRRLISSRFVWPKMSSEIGSWSRSCLQCQRSKFSSHVKSSVPQIPVPGRRFSHVHTDIVGTLQPSHGFHIFHIFIFMMIDRSTRWPAIVPISSITAESCIQAFTSTWVARFSVPDTLTSDRGSQFISSIWTGVCRELGITVSRTTSYNPQANGMIERFHRSLKVFLRAWAAGPNFV